jgi:hypothetical protein
MIKQYDKRDFDKCRFNPLEDNLFAAYPQLQGEFLSEDVRLLRYIFIMYDPASPLEKDEPEWPNRKKLAAYVAGYDLKKEGEYLQTIFTCADEELKRLTKHFLQKWVLSRVWAMIVSNLETFWEYQARLMGELKADKDKDLMGAVAIKSKISEDMEKINARIEGLLKQFYGSDEDLISQMEPDLKFNPQGIAKAIKRNNV